MVLANSESLYLILIHATEGAAMIVAPEIFDSDMAQGSMPRSTYFGSAKFRAAGISTNHVGDLVFSRNSSKFAHCSDVTSKDPHIQF